MKNLKKFIKEFKEDLNTAIDELIVEYFMN